MSKVRHRNKERFISLRNTPLFTYRYLCACYLDSSTCGFGLGSFQPEDDSSDDVVVNNELMKGAPVCV